MSSVQAPQPADGGRLLVRLLLAIGVGGYFQWLSPPVLIGARHLQLLLGGYALLQLGGWMLARRGSHSAVTRRALVWFDLVVALVATVADGEASAPMFLLIVLTLLNAGVLHGRAVYVQLLVVASAAWPAGLVYQASLRGTALGPDRIFHLALALVAGFCGYLLVARVRQLREEIDSEDDRDRLTGLWNRRTFMRSAEYMLTLARRSQMPLVLVVVAVEDLESADERWGHEVGDRALKQLASIVKRRLRDSDLGARFDGDQLVLALAHATTVGARHVGMRLEEEFDAWAAEQGYEMSLTFAMRPLPADTEDVAVALEPLLSAVSEGHRLSRPSAERVLSV